MSVVALLKDSANILLYLWKSQVALEEIKIKFQIWAPQKWNLRMGLVPGPSCIRLEILMLLVIFAPSMHCHLGSIYYSFYEIIIPKRLTVQGGDSPVEGLSYLLFMQGQKHLVHLKVKRSHFVNNFPVYS